LNNDGRIDRADAALLAADFGMLGDVGLEGGDLNGDGVVGLADLAAR
jgi:hypothetical protein